MAGGRIDDEYEEELEDDEFEDDDVEEEEELEDDEEYEDEEEEEYEEDEDEDEEEYDEEEEYEEDEEDDEEEDEEELEDEEEYEEGEEEDEDEWEEDEEEDFEDEEELEDEEEEESGDEDEEEKLDPDAVLYWGRPTWINYWKSIFVATAGVVAGIVLWDRNGWYLFAALIFSFLLYMGICLRRSMSLYMVSPRRAEIIYGLITKSSQEVRVSDIRTINVKRHGFKGLIGVGTVEFSSAGGDGVEVVFEDVWAAQKVKALVRRLQDSG